MKKKIEIWILFFYNELVRIYMCIAYRIPYGYNIYEYNIYSFPNKVKILYFGVLKAVEMYQSSNVSTTYEYCTQLTIAMAIE